MAGDISADAPDDPAGTPDSTSDSPGRNEAEGNAANAPTSPTTDGRALRAERRRAERRTAITDAAKRVFRAKGYHQASVHDIIDEARIARGTFYLYYASKQEIFGELVDEFLKILRMQVKTISIGGGAPEPRDQLRANFRRVVSAVLAHEEVASVILRDPTGFDDESKQQVGRFFERVLQMLSAALRVGEDLGLVRECDRAIVSATALGGVQEVLVRMLAVHNDDDPSESNAAFRDPDRIADELLALFFRGIFV
ncbi:MAG: TetR/AcrR family transcriptional regulator [Nannocystaceae bacterium]|nr:TetR/AcrR family transcriptional regulator [Nannocystaceae bacterium]